MLENEALMAVIQVLLTADLATALGVAIATSAFVEMVKRGLIPKESKYYRISIIGSALMIANGLAFGYQLIVGFVDWQLPLTNGMLGAVGAVFGYDVLKSILQIMGKKKGNG